MTKTFIGTSKYDVNEQALHFATTFGLKALYGILTVRDGKYIKTVKFV